jgi:endonuclease-3
MDAQVEETGLLRDKAQAVYQRLAEAYGLPTWDHQTPPLDELVNTILSQNTNDRNRDVAYHNLRARFSTWESVRDSDPEAVIECIRPAGLANQKGPRIQMVLQQITQEVGSLNLDLLNNMSPAEALAWLMRFKGVGPKTASIVLQFSLAKPAFPVDTHVYRVSGRIGLRPEKMNVEQSHVFLAGLFDAEQYGPGHLNLIRLGREICHARSPEHEKCPVKELCDLYRSLE